MECKVISNDREALFLSTQFEFFRDSSHASRGKRNSIVPSITEIEIQKSGMKTKIEHTHLSPLFLFLYISFSIPLSLFLSFSLSLHLYFSFSIWSGTRQTNYPTRAVHRNRIIVDSSAPKPYPLHPALTVCIDFPRSVYQQLISPEP